MRRGFFELVADRGLRPGRPMRAPNWRALPTIRMVAGEWRRVRANVIHAIDGYRARRARETVGESGDPAYDALAAPP